MLLILLFGFLGICFLFIVPTSVAAQCPVCIVTVGGGMLLAKKLGIDDLLVSIWISALNTAISFWVAPKIKIKYLKNPYLLSFLLYFATLFYFYFTDQIGFSSNQVIGVDKIVFGQTIGLLVMFIANYLDGYVRRKNNNKVLFYYQKVIIPLSFLFIITLIFKFIFHL